MHNRNMAAYAMLALLIFLLTACAAPQGVIVSTIDPPRFDLRTEAALEGDAVLQAIIIDPVRSPAGTALADQHVAFYLRNALQDALTQTAAFNIRGPGSQMNVPRIRTEIQQFKVEDDIIRDGYVTRRGVAAVNFALMSSSGNRVGSTTETTEIISRQPVGTQPRAREDIMQTMAQNVCRDFVAKLVPTERREFREFTRGNTDVNNGISAAMNRDWDLAVELWEGVVARDDRNAPAYYNLGIAYEHKKMLRRALQNYAEARRLDPGKALYQRNYARLQHKLDASRLVEDIREEVREGSFGSSD